MKKIVFILLIVVLNLGYGESVERDKNLTASEIESVKRDEDLVAKAIASLEIEDDEADEGEEGESEDVVSSVQKNRERISFKENVNFIRDTDEEDIKEVLKAIAKENGSQIRIDESVKGSITQTFSMPLEGAWNMIVEEYNLNYKVIDGVILVDAFKLDKKIIVLKYLKAKKLEELLDNYEIIDQSVNRLEFGDGDLDNTVYIEGRVEVIKELENLIVQLEKAEELKIAEREKREAFLEKKKEAKLKEKRLEIEEQNLWAEKERKREELELKQNNAFIKEARDKEEMALKQQNALLQEEISRQELEQKNILFKNKLKELNKKMKIAVIPLKYINVSKSEIEFQGQKIQLESLEETLKGLLGTNYTDRNSSSRGYRQGTETAFLKIDQRTNSVIIKDLPERIEEVRHILKDEKIGLDRPPLLVEIEVTIAMGNSGFTEELGAKLGASRRDGDASYGLSSSNNVAQNINDMQGAETSSTVDLLQPVGALGLSSSMLFLGGKTILNVQLNAMENEGLGKVLSNPRIMTLNNREATILSGNSVSIPVATIDKMGLETIDTGISIKTKPHIVLENGENEKDCEILLDISIEKSSLGTVSREKIETSTSKINSNVMIKNGQTLILGGLFQYTKSDTSGGIPLLKDIPLIGLFFQTKNSALMKNELLFFITPRVITSDMVNKMQDDSYMAYKKSLEYHKENLNQRLNEEDATVIEEEVPTESVEVEVEEEQERKLTPLEMLAGEGEEEDF